MPGTLTVPELYLPLVESLAERYLVVLVHRRGYGTTERGPRPCSFELQTNDLLAVLDGLAEPAVVFGHSIGGVISLSAARSAPDRVARLVLYEPPLALLGAELVPMFRFCADAVAAGRPAAAVRFAFQVSGSPDVRDDTVSDRTVALLASGAAGLIADLECVTGMPAPDTGWAGITTPIRLVRGERSTDAYVRSMDLVRAMFPAAPCTVLPGEAHFPADMTLVADVIG